MSWGRKAHTEITLITARAEIESCSITVTYKIREQGLGYREYNSRQALCQGHKIGSKFLE